jgi:peptidoglycan/LPS O-acetylase OafA/YrhL
MVPAAPITSIQNGSVNSKYRPEIDGLRAFAVVAVIINHFNKDLLPSGYLGVDIFFVISGYVITSSLADRKSKNLLDFLTGFYERRIKRLVPALVVFVLITSVLISLFNPEPDVALDLGWRSLFGISNIFLFRSATDYFAEATELNPFTHTWSLGVEEQFYLLFPFLIWFSGFGQQKVKGARNLFFWVGALTVFSLITFIYLYQVNQPAAYFLMPPRFWEMAAGCLIFIGFRKRAKIEQSLEQLPPLLVVTAMVVIMFLPVSAAVPATTAMVALSAVLIACLKKGTAAYEFFTLEKIVYVGLISYSLYLWHWVVLSISRWTIGIHWWSVPIQVGLILLMAIGSYQYVEKPARQGSYAKARLKVLGGGVVVSGLASILLVAFSKNLSDNLFLGRKNVTAPDNLLEFVGIEPIKKNCRIFNSVPSPKNIQKECGNFISLALPTVYVVGDSHGLGLGQYLNEFSFRTKKFNVATIWGNACLFTSSVSSSFVHPVYKGQDCRKLQSDAIGLVKSVLKKRDALVVANSSINMLLPKSEIKYRDKNGVPVSNYIAKELFFEEIVNIFDQVRKRGANVFFYFNPDRFDPIDNPRIDCKGNSGWNGEWFDRLNNLTRPDKCLVPRSKVFFEYRKFFQENITELADKFGSEVLIDSLSTGVCDSRVCNGAFTVDGGHLQGWAIAYLANQIMVKAGYAK